MSVEPPPTDRYLFEKAPWSSPYVWWGFGAIFLGLDYITGPYIFFPVFFILPVLLAAWHSGRGHAAVYALFFCAARFGLYFIRNMAWDPFTEIANRIMHFGVLVLLASLTAHIARQTRKLRHRITTLEGILPTCAHCKAIRDENGEWTRIETYISDRTDAQFSHGVCPKCMDQHYSELFQEK